MVKEQLTDKPLDELTNESVSIGETPFLISKVYVQVPIVALSRF